MKTDLVVEKLDRLQTDLVELAFLLERKGSVDAADVAISASARVGELREELMTEEAASTDASDGEPPTHRRNLCPFAVGV